MIVVLISWTGVCQFLQYRWPCEISRKERKGRKGKSEDERWKSGLFRQFDNFQNIYTFRYFHFKISIYKIIHVVLRSSFSPYLDSFLLCRTFSRLIYIVKHTLKPPPNISPFLSLLHVLLPTLLFPHSLMLILLKQRPVYRPLLAVFIFCCHVHISVKLVIGGIEKIVLLLT